ncbi:MAG: T9SS type A sorting domain-containing protein [Bacteroidetes bacterium]|jgi:hypothetical protein|nr:T9SS type A sorting domain-containing protein [Bacteroidota bacterium]MBT5528695.1 T9SS type A sorting domain-containing protein [Cytophagia bacterium]MBT3424604.1 T9SS type A sorting domain-containing protein [Bacteroidota bacterium]MBT3802246.1 T9SS type A sorting domain-containing protein [Bacteroidota bacterium]MBT3933742.1 T9SS type A sorting domain-containing protein [Bacteroidota bacterium]
MKTITSFLILMVFFQLSSRSQNCADTNNIFTVSFNAKKYEIVKEKKNWTEAAACAVERGGYLAEINNSVEQDLIYGTIKNNAGISSNYTTVNDGGGIAYIWIGATDKNTEGSWLWDGDDDASGVNFWNGQGGAGSGGGSAVAGLYNNWGGTSEGTVKEPDDYASNQDGAAIALAGWPSGTTLLGIAGEWNDISSANTIYYVIEYDSSTSSMNEIELDEVFIYPNPATEIVYIRSSSLIFSVKIINALGEFVVKKEDINQNSITLPLNSFDQGFYWVRIQHSNSITVEQLLIH